MYLAEIQLDRHIPDGHLIVAFADVFGIESQGVTVWPRGMVDDRTAAVILQKEDAGGDFPLLISINVEESLIPPDGSGLLTLAQAISTSLDAALITDSVGVNPLFDDDFLLVAPDGSTAVVQIDVDLLDSEDPTIVLVPESRAVYEALVHRRLAATG